MSVEELLNLRWSWQGPERKEVDGDVYYEATIAELPDFFVAGETQNEVVSEMKPALRAYLESFIEHGDPLPGMPDVLWRFSSPHILTLRPEGIAVSEPEQFTPTV
jgi:predicted RNase H-like HicB family nuclease